MWNVGINIVLTFSSKATFPTSYKTCLEADEAERSDSTAIIYGNYSLFSQDILVKLNVKYKFKKTLPKRKCFQ